MVAELGRHHVADLAFLQLGCRLPERRRPGAFAARRQEPTPLRRPGLLGVLGHHVHEIFTGPDALQRFLGSGSGRITVRRRAPVLGDHHDVPDLQLVLGILEVELPEPVLVDAGLVDSHLHGHQLPG